MKLVLIVLSVFILSITLFENELFSQEKFIQDTIITKKGEVIACEITLIKSVYLTYKTPEDFLDIRVEKVKLVKYKNVWFVNNRQALETINPIELDSILNYTDEMRLVNLSRVIPMSDSLANLYKRLNIAGANLEKGADTYFTGIAMIIGGGFLAMAGAANNSMLLIGGFYVLEIVGTVLTITYMSSIKDAGRILRTLR